jgi:hypothetical protein
MIEFLLDLLTAIFLLVMYYFDKVFKSFAIKAKSFVKSSPFKLNLLWDDRHPCYITKMKKDTVKNHNFSILRSMLIYVSTHVKVVPSNL